MDLTDDELADQAVALLVRITNMNPGQYALYPHFRSDGWIYFIVRDSLAGVNEYVVPRDAILVP